MIKINPIEVLLWNLRRSEKDVIHVYDKLTPLMKLGAQSEMINFGLWNNEIEEPIVAQRRMCDYISSFGNFLESKKLLDVGSGFGAPAIFWNKKYPNLDITCLNLNFGQLNNAKLKNNLYLINSTSTSLPFENKTFDRIIALESAHHFKPLKNFIEESRRVITTDGVLILAIPVINEKRMVPLKLGILNFTWASQHHSKECVIAEVNRGGFKIQKLEDVGSRVYEPLAEYYLNNRVKLKKCFRNQYSDRIEGLVFRSIEKMKKLSQKKIIEYCLFSLKPS